MGAGLNFNIAKMSESATNDRWPPESSPNDSFHLSLNAILTSRPSRHELAPGGGTNLAFVPGKRVENIEPKSYNTISKQVLFLTIILLC